MTDEQLVYCTCPDSYPQHCGHHPDCASQKVPLCDVNTTEPSSPWISFRDLYPDVGQLVVLANVEQFRSDDQLGCVKDIGVLKHTNSDHYYWAVMGEHRSKKTDSYTHWMPLQEPPHD